MKIRFFLRFHTNYGQSLFVMGNHALLGQNQETNAFPLTYFNSEFWTGIIEIDPTDPLPVLQYKYLLKNADGFTVQEWGDDRKCDLKKAACDDLQFVDVWNHAGEFENAFYSNPFQEVLLKENETRQKIKSPKAYNFIFKAKAPLLSKNEVLCVSGSGPLLGDWDTLNPILLQRENGWWSAKLQLPRESFPLQYKYGIYNIKNDSFVKFEEGPNRQLLSVSEAGLVTLHDGFVRLPNTTWKGAGLAIPVFSLRSKDSFGVGEFNDLKLLTDWAVKTGLRMLQILPVNDTTATHTWKDSYPYAAISAFALHPLFINLESVAGKEHAALIKPLRKKQKELNAASEVDYEEVMRFKLAVLKELFQVKKDSLQSDPAYNAFFDKNRYWLVPYAAFCYLRDRNGTPDFNQWKLYGTYNKASIEKYVAPKARHYEEILFHYFVQYHLHLQLKEAADYAHEKGIILKGDIPIGIYRYSVDAWMNPALYHMDMQAGAPPDDFAIHGQNWGFPTYNWEQMERDQFEWWHERFVQMGDYFDAFRIDHILGFFRIWSIPVTAVEGIMGRFVPAIPVHINELSAAGISFDHYRFCSPYISDAVLWDFFGPNQSKFKEFLDSIGDGFYALKDAFATQQRIDAYFKALEESEENKNIRQGLMDLASNVILFEEEGSHHQQFHFRFNMEQTASFRYLEERYKQPLKDLYVDYYFKRQDAFWMKEAMKKLPALKRSTNMLICGEDLGLVPECVPDVMKQLGILSLEIQRMPKALGKEFFHPTDAPYMSVVTPSTHDMSTIRGWWEEDREKTQRFYNQELGQWGDAPAFCEPWISRAIILQHLYSPAMWSVFQLQDLMGMSASIRREDPHGERVNIPANPNHYWRYRMHLSLEELLKEKEFNNELSGYLEASGRAQ